MIVPVPPDTNEEKEIVRLSPDPPQVPPALTLHETKLKDEGRLSVTFTELALFGPAFVTVRVKVAFAPAWTGSGEAPMESPRSARERTLMTVNVETLLEEMMSAELAGGPLHSSGRAAAPITSGATASSQAPAARTEALPNRGGILIWRRPPFAGLSA
jgi:hypothetical protein